jgi:HEAT repeat protein
MIMKTAKLIPMDREHRLQKKVNQYISNSELFFSNASDAVTLFLDALPHADSQLLLKMLPLLGCAGDDRVLWPLFHLITSKSLDDPLRASASIHLGLAASLSQNPTTIRNALIEKLNHPNPAIRCSCALSLGWKGNSPAIGPLAAHLSDADQDVRAAVIAALSSVEGIDVLALLENRLEYGTKEELRVIFLHLWRFRKHISQVEDIYIKHITKVDTDLRLDILVGLAMLPLSPKLIDLYRSFLVDKHARIRHQILENLSTVSPLEYKALKHHLRQLLDDEDARVRQAAIKLFARLE